MPIPESQLETWSHQGAVVTSSTTYRSIQTALGAGTSPIREKNYEVYLQGSYRNDTNIRGDSDVDVVVQFNSTFGYDLAPLPEEQKREFHASYPTTATYLWEHFRADVLQALRAYYGAASVIEGNKSLKLASAPGRLAADIIPSIVFRKYQSFYGINAEAHVEGIRFHSRRDNRMIVNFPKSHYDNGVAKNAGARTNGRYKPTVRMFKNARTYLIDRRVISEDLAPSYFLESLIYNAPDRMFGSSYQETCAGILNYFWKNPIATFVCQNEQGPLFGDAPEQWRIEPAVQTISALIGLWNNWRT